MQRSRSPRPGDRRTVHLAALALYLVISGLTGASRAEDRALQLEVLVNGQPTNLIAAFTRRDDGMMAAEPAELAEIGLDVGDVASDGPVVLDRVEGLSYIYDEAQQRILITVGDGLRVVKTYAAQTGSENAKPAQGDFGGVLNYDLRLSASVNDARRQFAYDGTSASLDGRVFSKFGVFDQSAILRYPSDGNFDALRLDSTFTHSDRERILTYRAGDTITGGLLWTRPIRIGGLQVSRNFSTRPDLVTQPLPAFSGSAAVPSTVDVYVDNLKILSQDVDAGPFEIFDLPSVSGAGDAKVVIRDSSGKKSEQRMSLFSSALLLRPGLSDFSVEAGAPRASFGTESGYYIATPIVSATLRRGMTDALTLEAHGEGRSGMVNGGMGAVFRAGPNGVVNAAVSASSLRNGFGVQAYAAYEGEILGLSVRASTQRTFGAYKDLAMIDVNSGERARGSFGGNIYRHISQRNDPPKGLDKLTVGLPPLPFDPQSNVSVSFINLVTAADEKSRIVTASWLRPLSPGASMHATAFADFGDSRGYGVFAGLSVKLGGVSTFSSVSTDGAGTKVTFDASKPLGENPGSYGWRIHDSEGSKHYRAAELSYRTNMAKFNAAVEQSGENAAVTAEVEGAVATLGRNVFLANRIDDAFAVVDTGGSDVGVKYENRPAGRTGKRGKMLLPGLRSFENNRISIDTDNLPVDARIETTEKTVVPAERAGVLVRFPVETTANSAILVIVGKDGSNLPVGAQGQLEDGSSFVVGYDGQAYVEGLKRNNRISVTLSYARIWVTGD
jgi:outer membrane usher protein